MRRLVGFGTRKRGDESCCLVLTSTFAGVLESYCFAAFAALQSQKESFLQEFPDALYPSASSVFSAATVEFSGPHLRATNSRHEPTTWSILIALGHYSATHGGHIILWDLGLIVGFPSGCCILLPTGLIRYSFVKVRANETRHSIVQWAGPGITRWLQNGKCSDIEFAARASREEHSTREARRELAQDDSMSAFPAEGEFGGRSLDCAFYGALPQDDSALSSA
ncbi:hypothetical protein C8R46DRAFT_879457 [Mycena filopes]|nr:hypothetical protein C8R46DRAFT_879457 [Mycena filopes]